MNLVQPRTDIGLIMLIVGVLLTGLFGWIYWIALAAMGFAVVAHSILHGNNPGKLMIAVLVLWSLGAVWFTARHNLASHDPPSLDSVTGFAEEYRTALAETDLEAYTAVAKPMLGDTLEETLAVEAQCLEWSVAQIVVAPQESFPFLAVVTFHGDDSELVRQFSYQSQTDKWTVRAEPNC